MATKANGRNAQQQTGELWDRLPPQNLEAEKGVLGSMMLGTDAIDEVATRLSSSDFYVSANGLLFTAILDQHRGNRPVDAVTVANKLDAIGMLDDVGVPYISEILEAVPNAAHAVYYADLVRQEAMRRQIIYVGTRAIRKAFDDRSAEPSDIVSEFDSELINIVETYAPPKSHGMDAILLAAFDQILDQKTATIKTGFHVIDNKVQIRPGNLVYLAARPGVGKTALAGCMSLGMGKLGEHVLFYSLEQTDIELAERYLSQQTGIDGNTIRAGELSAIDRQILVEAANELSNMPIDLDSNSGQTVWDIAAKARIKKRRGKLDAIIIDYLQLVKPEDRRIPREQQVAAISQGLKAVAKDLDVAVICLCQLNRQIEMRENKKPRLSDLRESGSIEQDGDIILFLDHPADYGGKYPPNTPGVQPDSEIPDTVAALHVAKNRNGKSNETCWLYWNSRAVQFRDGTIYDERY